MKLYPKIELDSLIYQRWILNTLQNLSPKYEVESTSFFSQCNASSYSYSNTEKTIDKRFCYSSLIIRGDCSYIKKYKVTIKRKISSSV